MIFVRNRLDSPKMILIMDTGTFSILSSDGAGNAMAMMIAKINAFIIFMIDIFINYINFSIHH